MRKWMILMFENDNAWAAMPADAKAKAMQSYYAWVEGLQKAGAYVSGAPLGRGGHVLTPAATPGGRPTDAPYTQTSDVLTGFFLIQTSTEQEALEIARACPGLSHGERILLRPVVTPGASEHMD